MRYTYRVYYFGTSDKNSILIRAKSKADAERKFKRKFPDRKIMLVV